MRDKLLTQLAIWHTRHPWKLLAVAVLITIVLGICAAHLSINMQMKDLLPSGDPRVDQFNEIIDEFTTATSLIVVVQGDEDNIKAFADDLAPRVLTLKDTSQNSANRTRIRDLRSEIESVRTSGESSKTIAALENRIKDLQNRIDFKLFQRVDYKAETDFIRNHGLMLVKAEDLKNTREMFTNPNLTELITHINDSMEKEYVGQQESISTREKEDGAVSFLDGIQALTTQIHHAAAQGTVKRRDVQRAADTFLLGEPYFLSYDKSTLILNLVPNFTIMDRDLIAVADEETQALVDDLLERHPGVRAGLSGDIAREYDEQVYSQKSLGVTTLIAFIAILILLIIAFRMWVAPLLAILTLGVGIIWANGLAFLVVGRLNMVTAMLSVVLLGLGIDFAIHIISGFTEWRAAGNTIQEALRQTFLKNGKGIITGALTTACAFLALLVSKSRGMQEMGIVTGVGLIAIMLATFLFLPAMLVLRERFLDYWRGRKSHPAPVRQRDISLHPLGSGAEWLSKHYPFTLVTSIAISALLITSALNIKYEQNYHKMEPKGLTSIALTDTINEKFDLSMEYALCLVDDVKESQTLAEAFRDQGTVAMTEDISVYLPTPAQQRDRAPHLEYIRKSMQSTRIKTGITDSDLSRLRQELERLEMNVIEMQDMAFLGGQDKVDNKCQELVGDPLHPDAPTRFSELFDTLSGDARRIRQGLSRFQSTFAPYFKENVIKMASTNALQLGDLPESVLDRYSNADRDKFLITIYPAGQLFADASALNRFVDDMQQVSRKTTGTPLVSVAWMKIAARDGRNAILLTLAIVFLLLWADFRKPHYALIAMIPLALGVFWMVGLMNLAGILLSFMTMMGLPLIIGIGIDDGVHIVHRWQHEGDGHIHTVFASTGKAILITSLTTMLAFGSMTFSLFPAWAWFGESLFIGVGACFLTSVLILPGIMGWMETKRNRKN